MVSLHEQAKYVFYFMFFIFYFPWYLPRLDLLNCLD